MNEANRVRTVSPASRWGNQDTWSLRGFQRDLGQGSKVGPRRESVSNF